MSSPIQLKRSATPAKVPTTSDLALGEIGINTYDGKMYIKKDNGTPSIIEVGAGGGSSPYVVGQVVQAPSAPSDGGTWLDCDGSSKLQSSYSALYTAIGQQFLRYQLTTKFQPGGTTANTQLFDGSKWISARPGSVSVVTSSNGGLTWGSATAFPGSIATTLYAWTNESGTALYYGPTSTTAYRTTSSAASAWTTVTLPSTGAWIMANNGANVIGVKPSSNAIIISSDAGATWSTSASTLPVTLSSTAPFVWWDGAKWIILQQAASTATIQYTTSDSTGAASWTTSYPTAGIPIVSNKMEVVPGTTNVVSATGDAVRLSADSGLSVSNTLYTPGNAGMTNTNQPIWNGLHFIAFTNTGLITTMTLDGKLYVSDYVLNSPAGLGGGFGIIPPNPNISLTGRSDKANYRVVHYGPQAVGTTNDLVACIWEPSINVSTNFNVPKFNAFSLSSKSWIKAS